MSNDSEKAIAGCFILTLWLLAIVLNLAFWGGIVWVAVHLISKWW